MFRLSLPHKIKANARDIMQRLGDWIDMIQGSSDLIRADFEIGGKTMYSYLRTHRNRYHRNVGAHFLVNLYESGPEVLEHFAERHREFGWHFPLTHVEQTALRAARDTTCAHSHISGLRYTTNIFNQLANRKQLLRMLGLGLVAGSAGILLGLSELLFIAKERAKEMLGDFLGMQFDAGSQNQEFINLANKITEGASGADGQLDQGLVAERIGDLVASLEQAQNSNEALHLMNADFTYVIGIISGILLLVIGRGLVQLVVEGLNGAVNKIDSLVKDMDEFCDWKLGRSPFMPASEALPGDLILRPQSILIRPKSAKDVPPNFRAS